MRLLRRQRAIGSAHGFLARSLGFARELRHQAARSEALAGKRRSPLADDLIYFAELVAGTVAWLSRALPPRALAPVKAEALSPLDAALRRLGLPAEDARRDAMTTAHYLRVLEASDWDLTIAARVLGVSRRTLARFGAEKGPRR
jgi:hypothetical protein